MPEQFLFTKEKGLLFDVRVWMKPLVKKSTPCYGNKNRNRNMNIRSKVVDEAFQLVHHVSFILCYTIL